MLYNKKNMKLSLVNFLKKHLIKACLGLILLGLCFSTSPALASMNDDKYDGNIFIIYAGNGSLVPPRLTLAESRQREMPALIVFYADDSSDCKQYSSVISRLQEYYGRAADLIPVAVDSIPVKDSYTTEEVGYYYTGEVPQTVLINQKGEVVLNGKGQLTFEELDDAFRKVFDLLPRSESVALKRRTLNEFNVELSK
jgi:Thioredoxin-like domain